MKTITVTMENCEEVAMELVDELLNQPLMVVSIAVGVNLKDELRTIPAPAKTMSGFTFENGLLTIPLVTMSLKPSRKISWDVVKERVTITYLDSGSIRIERVDLGKDKTIYRMITKLKL